MLLCSFRCKLCKQEIKVVTDELYQLAFVSLTTRDHQLNISEAIIHIYWTLLQIFAVHQSNLVCGDGLCISAQPQLFAINTLMEHLLLKLSFYY